MKPLQEMEISIVAPNAESAGAVRADRGPGVNQFICRSEQDSATAQSNSIKLGRKREKL